MAKRSSKKPRIKIISDKNLMLHFKEEVDKEIAKLGLNISEATSFYIVNLLASYFRTEKLFASSEKGFEEITLAEILKRALESDLANKLALLKRLGDHSLYIAGFFSDYLKSKIVDVDYYINLGGNAYSQLADIFKEKGNKEFAGIYFELFNHFINLVQLLSEMSDESFIKSNQDLLRIYEKWLITKSRKMEEKLKEEGIIPPTAQPKNVH